MQKRRRVPASIVEELLHHLQNLTGVEGRKTTERCVFSLPLAVWASGLRACSRAASSSESADMKQNTWEVTEPREKVVGMLHINLTIATVGVERTSAQVHRRCRKTNMTNVTSEWLLANYAAFKDMSANGVAGVNGASAQQRVTGV